MWTSNKNVKLKTTNQRAKQNGIQNVLWRNRNNFKIYFTDKNKEKVFYKDRSGNTVVKLQLVAYFVPLIFYTTQKISITLNFLGHKLWELVCFINEKI